MPETIWTPTDSDPGLECPSCGAWPFSDAEAVAEHSARWHQREDGGAGRPLVTGQLRRGGAA